MPGRFGEPTRCLGFSLPLPQTARCALDANPSLGPSLLSKVQLVPGSEYRRVSQLPGGVEIQRGRALEGKDVSRRPGRTRALVSQLSLPPADRSTSRRAPIASPTVIVALHAATGAAVGAATRSRTKALLLGPMVHLAGDYVPHEDFRSRRFEIGSGVAALVLLAARRGLFDPATIGAAASASPDLEHVLPFLRPGGRKLFHDRLGWHRAGRLPAVLQLALACAIIAALARR